MQTLRSLFGLLLVAAAVYVTWMVARPFFANFQFEEAVEDAARSGTADYRRTDQEIQEEVLKQARELNVPVTAEDVHVERVNSEVMVWSDYTVRVDLPVHPIELRFQPASKSKKKTM